MAQLENLNQEIENQNNSETMEETLEFRNMSIYNYSPLFPKELSADITKMTLGPVMHQSKTAYSYKLYYQGKKILIQTPIIKCMFGLQKYCYPNSTADKYSIHLGFGCSKDNEDIEEIKQFKNFLTLADDYVKTKINLPVENFHSALRYNYSDPNKAPVLRVKIPSKETHLLFEIYDKEEELFEPIYKEACEKIKHGTEVRCILELNTVWKANDKWGLSYKLLQVEIISQLTAKMFRGKKKEKNL